MKKLFLLLAGATTLLFSSCDNLNSSSEKKVKIGGQYEVYYEGEVTKEEATALGEFLAEEELFGEEGDKAKLTKEDDEYIVHLAYDEDSYEKNKDLYLFGLNSFPARISKEVFDGEATRLILADEEFAEVEEVKKMNMVKFGKEGVVYYRGRGVTKEDAKKLGDYLTEINYFNGDNTKMVFLTQKDGEYNVRFIVDRKKVKENEDEVVHAFQVFQHLISLKVFRGQKSNVLLTDTKMKDMQNVGELSSQEKYTINDELDRISNPELFAADTTYNYPALDTSAYTYADTTGL
jgi:hypothetical protein